MRNFDSAPPIAHSPKYSVLDGQQRLTSLYQALTGQGENIYAIKWEQESTEELDEYVVSFTRTHERSMDRFRQCERNVAERFYQEPHVFY